MGSDPVDDATRRQPEDKPDRTLPAGPRAAGRADLASDDTIRQDSTRSVPAADAPGPRIRISRPSHPPIRLGRYKIVKLLGTGGMGAVYEGHDAELDRRVAIKVLRDDRLSDTLTEGLRREAQALAKLVHPNVVAVHDVGFDQGQLFVVMQLIDGESIDQWLRARSAGPAKIVATFLGAGRGLAAAHAANIVHCDFKPGNVLVDRDGVVRVGDFGLARIGAEGEGSIAGTPRYMAPEQFAGVATPASDQYAFCIALWEALAGKPPFPDTSLDHGNTPPVRTAPELPASARVPGYLTRALLRGLSDEPSDRFPSMDALLDALSPPAWRRWAIAGAAGGAAIGVAIVATFVVAARSPASTPASRAVLDAGIAGTPVVEAPRALTHLGRKASACSPTVEGDHVVFERMEGDAVDLYSIARTGGEARQLTSTDAWEWRAHAGRRPGEVIHLLQDPTDFKAAKIAYLDTATGRETVAAKLATPDAAVIDDGLVYISPDLHDLRRLVGEQDVVLAHAPAGYLFHFLTLSHHRDRVAAIAEKQGTRQLCLVDVKTAANSCTPTKAFETRPAFGADDRTLYYNTVDGIHRQVLATGEDTLLVPDVIAKGGIAVADDGSLLAYSNCGASEQLVDWTTQKVLVDDPGASTPTGTTADHVVWVRWYRGHPVLIAGGEGHETQLTEAQLGPISEPAMSPDGQVVAFRAGAPHPGIYTLPLGSARHLQRITEDEHDHLPVWVGDDQLAFTRKDEHDVGTVFTAASDGGMLRQLPGAGRTAIGGRDQRLLVATHWKLYWIDLVTGRERPGPELPAAATTNSHLVTSPDGRWLLVESGAEGQLLARMHLDPLGPLEPLEPLSSAQTIEGWPSITNDGHVLLAPESWSGDIFTVAAKPGSRL